jgi:predicted N-acetyltransferase YhbS
MVDVVVRHEAPEDWTAVEAVVRDAFRRGAEVQLVSKLRRRADVLSIVAIAHDVIVRHPLFSAVMEPREPGGAVQSLIGAVT